ncbi:hypothetical protein ABEY24_16365 [Peribacillus frigoritolerans]|uniref:hypothetical protein n=1 Tax=Peribacillus frigoritolerans TaxID=450367 RepID=UPI003D27BEDE
MKKLQLISEIRSLSADSLPSLLDASVCGVSASQLFGRSVANFFNPIRITGKSMKDKLILNMLRDETNSQFFFEKIAVDFRNALPFRRLSAKPHQSKRLRGPGQPVRQECRKFLQSNKDYRKKHEG